MNDELLAGIVCHLFYIIHNVYCSLNYFMLWVDSRRKEESQKKVEAGSSSLGRRALKDLCKEEDVKFWSSSTSNSLMSCSKGWMDDTLRNAGCFSICKGRQATTAAE